MHEPPRFFEKIIEDPIIALFEKLGLNSQPQQRGQSRKAGPTRHRLPYLDENHRPIARSCLVYRITLNRSQFSDHGLISDVSEKLDLLRAGSSRHAIIVDV